MGPRFFNRGNDFGIRVAFPLPHPSMGPRFFNRGNTIRLSKWAAENTRFNGAAVFQPRKCRRRLLLMSA